MGVKRTVRTYRDTRAKGDRTTIEGHRYFILVELVSVKVEEESDLFGRSNEVYIECGKSKMRAVRTPSKGEIVVEANEVFKPTGGLTLYSEFREEKDGKTIELPFKVYDRDIGDDDKLIDTKISISLGQSREYLSFSENGMRVKIGVSAKKTRF